MGSNSWQAYPVHLGWYSDAGLNHIVPNAERVGLLERRKIELPPVRERQVRRIAERDAFAEACLEPAKEAFEAAISNDAKRGECFSGVLRVLAKIDVVERRGPAERDERLAGGTHKCAGLEDPFAERLEIQIVVGGGGEARAESVRRKRHQKRVR